MRLVLRPLASLRGDRLDRIEEQRAVPPDRERQVARGKRIAGADRPAVRVVDEQAAEADDETRPQVAPLLRAHASHNAAAIATPMSA